MTPNELCAGATRVVRRSATRTWRRIRTGTTLGSFAMLALAACSLWLPAEGNFPSLRRGPSRVVATVVSVAEASTPGDEGQDRTYAALRRLFPADWEREAGRPDRAR